MADAELDPFDDPVEGPVSSPGIMQEWNDALNDPGVRGALLSAGLSLMQPPQFGQTTMGSIGEAIGAAGQSVAQREKMDTVQREADSKEALRGAQADSATSRSETAAARAGTAAANAQTATTRLQLQQQEGDRKKEQGRLSAILRAQGLYQNYVKDVNKRNADVLRTGPAEEVKSFDDWIATNPELAASITSGSTASTPRKPAPSGGYPPLPTPDKLVPGTTYQTPRGPLRYDEDGKFRSP